MRKISFLSLLGLLLLLVACPSSKTSAPEVSISNTETMIVSSTLKLTGTAKDSQGIRALNFQVNDGLIYDITEVLDNDTFSADITLQKGANTIVVTAVNLAGESAKATFNVSATPASISGNLWEDANSNGVKDEGEVNLVARTVYLDQNDNGILDKGEQFVKTDEQGKYAFSGLEPDRYIIRQVVPFGEINVFSKGIQIAAKAGDSITNNIIVENLIPPKVIGGRDTDTSQFPFMLALGSVQKLGDDSRFSQFCGATLISATHALTASHCLAEKDLNNIYVLIGASNLAAIPETAQLVKVAKATQHPEYERTDKGYDVAVLELAEELELENDIYTVDLMNPNLNDFIKNGEMTTITGWGTTAFGTTAFGTTNPVQQLQIVHSKIFDRNTCKSAIEAVNTDFPPLENMDTQLCSGLPEGGVDACQGDSGGPLFVRGTINEESRWLLAGVTSWGQGCGLPGLPGIWADVSALSGWIEDNAIGEVGVAKVIFRNEPVTDVDFANKKSIRPLISTIADRWQVANFSLQGEDLFIEKGQKTTFDWVIFEEGDGYQYTCIMSIEGQLEPKNVPCQVGTNTFVIEQGLIGGVYKAKLEVTATNVAAEKSVQENSTRLFVAESVAKGTLGENDLTDPEYPNYVMDYFELTGLTVGAEVELQHQGLPFPLVLLYNKNLRDSATGGGYLTEGAGADNTPLNFVVEEGVDYLVAISTDKVITENFGDYQIATSLGTFTPSTFGQ